MCFSKPKGYTNVFYAAFYGTLCSTLLLLSGCKHFDVSPQANDQLAIQNQDQIQDQSLARDTANQTKTNPGFIMLKPDYTAKPEILDPQAAQTAAAPSTAWDHIIEKPGFHIQTNKRIEAQKQWYLHHTGYLNRLFEKTELFLPYVLEELDKRNMPRILALLPIVESSYDPHAISKSGAMGAWQFMPLTAEYYGLEMNWWYDGRKDIVASTDAALRYLDVLQTRFDGDWLLAVASYNGGGGTINKAVRANTNRGLKTDFWSLKLREETHNYVPRLLALLEIITEAPNLGVNLPKLSHKSPLVATPIQRAFEIRQAAALSGLSIQEVQTYNPGLKHWALDPEKPYELLLPIDAAARFNASISRLPKTDLVSWHQHKVKAGDTMSEIAQYYNVPYQEIKRINQLATANIRIGQSLYIPKPNQPQTSAKALALRTAMKPNTKPPQAQALAQAQAQAQAQQKVSQTLTPLAFIHQVTPGETLWGISRSYKTSVNAIQKANQMSSNQTIRPGLRLTIPLEADGQILNYQVRAGDSLYKIASRFNVSVQEIASWNELDRKSHLIKPGQQLKLFIEKNS